MLPNVPRISTSCWPRRAPYELKSSGATPCSWSHWPAGDQAGIDPAGEMWSVVTESPSTASARAPTMSVTGAGSRSHAVHEGRPRDVGRGRVPVIALASPPGTGSARQWASPSKTLA